MSFKKISILFVFCAYLLNGVGTAFSQTLLDDTRKIVQKYPKASIAAGAASVAGLVYLYSQIFAQNNSPSAEIKGQLVTLRQLRPEYYQGYKAIFSEPVRKALGLSDDASVNRLIAHSLLDQIQGESLVYCIFDNKDDSIIGGIEIRRSGFCGNLGNWLNDKYWGRGFYQEALGLVVLQYFKNNPKADYLTAHVRKENLRSYASLKKFGFEEFEENPENKFEFDDFTLKFSRMKLTEKQWQFAHNNLPEELLLDALRSRWVWQ